MVPHSSSIPSFFKVCVEDFANTMRMPPPFLHHLREKRLPGTITIVRTQPQEITWNVSMELTEHGYYFTHGWSKLVQDLNLCLGDFLFFYLIGRSMLEILPCGHNCCPKPLINQPQPRPQPLHVFHNASNPKSFMAEMKKSNKYILNLPQVFSSWNRLEEKKCVTLVNPGGRKWDVQVCPRKNKRTGQTFRVDLGNGWNDFRAANELADGVECSFKLIGGEGTNILVSLTTPST